MKKQWLTLLTLGALWTMSPTTYAEETIQTIDLSSVKEAQLVLESGQYRLTGQYNGQIVVQGISSEVTIVLDNVELSHEVSPLVIEDSQDVQLILQEGSSNNISVTGVEQEDGHDAGIYTTEDMTISGTGILEVHSASGHSIKSKDNITVDSGNIILYAAKDGIHANDTLTIHNGTINVMESNEGLEADNVVIQGGEITIKSDDDGINGQSLINIIDGTVTIDAAGDGVDSNGELQVAGGVTLIAGPEDNGNGAVDYETEATITGGTFVAIGSNGMAENFGQNSTQVSILETLNQMVTGNIVVKDGNNNIIATFQTDKKINSIVVSSPNLKVGDSYTIEIGDTVLEGTISQIIQGQGMGGMIPGGMGMPPQDRNGMRGPR